MKYLLLVIEILFLFPLAAQDAGFTLTPGEEDSVIISLSRTPGISSAELYRDSGKGDPVIIYEFMEPGETFVEKAEPGTCYFLKIYSDYSGTITTARKCYSGKKYMNFNTLSMLMLLLLFLVSIVLPVFLKGRFINNTDSDYTAVIKRIVVMMNEGGGGISVETPSDAMNSMLFYVTASLADRFRKSEKIEYSGYYGCISSGMNDSFMINMPDGYRSCKYDEIYDGDRKQICFSSTVAGIGMNSINGRRCLVSVEPFLAASMFMNDRGKGLKPSGAYLFLAAVLILIILGSVFRTLNIFLPVSDWFSFFKGGN